jgi:hypothetical protein
MINEFVKYRIINCTMENKVSDRTVTVYKHINKEVFDIVCNIAKHQKLPFISDEYGIEILKVQVLNE